MSIRIRPFSWEDGDGWDRFCSASLQSTLLHTRRFLSYHGSRFVDRSLIAENAGEWIGILPAAETQDDTKCVVSHPGATYGGLLHQGNVAAAELISIFQGIFDHYSREGISRFIYKSVPHFYHTSPAQEDLYALFRLGGRRIRTDLSSTINLRSPLPLSARRRRCLQKSIRAGVTVSDSVDHLQSFWLVLEQNLRLKRGKAPVHTFAEISLLFGRFPDEIRLFTAHHDQSVVAGVLLFRSRTCYHAQYIASNDSGNAVSALDLIFQTCVLRAHEEGRIWFDFGISTENAGTSLNEGLHQFKSEFGAGATVYEHYQIDLGEN